MSKLEPQVRETFIDSRFGFPVRLEQVEMVKVRDEWIPNVNANELRNAVLNALVTKPAPWTGAEVRFVRLSLAMTQSDFGELVAVTHASVSKWESKKNEPVQMTLSTEFMLRFKVFSRLPGELLIGVRADDSSQLSASDMEQMFRRRLADLEDRITPHSAAGESSPVAIDGRTLPNPGTLPIGTVLRA